MSGTGESDDSYQHLNSQRAGNRRRRIVMRIEFDDSDDENSGNSSGDFNPVRNLQRKRRSKRLVTSSDESSSDSEVPKSTNTEVNTEENSKIQRENNVSQETLPNEKGENGFSSDANDNGYEQCPICLYFLCDQEIGIPSVCKHVFCALCIEEWAKYITTCPIDRREFKSILVFDSFFNRRLVREINVESKNNEDCANAENENEDEDNTYCEICGRADREDVMLLCEDCNQGYHMDCLTPPLTEIPEGYWYCDNCFASEDDVMEDDIMDLLYEDLREMGVPETRLRITEMREPVLPRTRQSERIRARIVARARVRRSVREPQVAEVNMPTPSTSRLSESVTRSQSRSLCDEKFGIKITRRYVRKRRSRRGSRVGRRKAAACRNNEQVNLSSPAKCLSRAERRLFATNRFSLFGNRYDLDYFSDSDNNFTDGISEERGGTSIQTAVRFRNIGSSLYKRKARLREIQPPIQQSGTVDILSSIIDMQNRWYNASRQQLRSVRIGDDGALIFENNSQQTVNKENEKGTVTSESVSQAPLYSRGENPNMSTTSDGYNNRYDTQTNSYRGPTTSRSNTSNYRASTGSIGYNMNPFRRDDNRGFQQIHSNNINLTPNFRDRFRNQNQRQDRRNLNRFSSNENVNAEQNSCNIRIETTNLTPIQSTENVLKHSSAEPSATPAEGNTPPLPVFDPINSNVESVEDIPIPSAAIPPLAPPPWNKNLFRLTGDCDDDDDDGDCPNFSIYSAESLQVARSSKENEESSRIESEKKQEDDSEEKEEDLVQLGDDDEIPAAIDNIKKEEDESEMYEPENPTGENDDDEEIDNQVQGDDGKESGQHDDVEEMEEKIFVADGSYITELVKKSSLPQLYDERDWATWNMNKTELLNNLVCQVPDVKDEDDDDDFHIGSELYEDSLKEEDIKDENTLDEDIIAENTRSENIIAENIRNEQAKNENARDENIRNEDTRDEDVINTTVKTEDVREEVVQPLNETTPHKENSKEDKSNETQGNIQTESISDEEDRSYTPCLDEKIEHEDRTPKKVDEALTPPQPVDKEKAESERGEISTAVIDGMETELISDEDEEILNQEQNACGSKKKGDDDGNDQGSKKGKKETFKKISKNTKERNYRVEKERVKEKRPRSRSRSNDKENQNVKANERKRIKRKEIERYDVRNIIGQPRTYKDRYGRDTSRPPKSRSRSRSRSRRRRSRSRSRSRSHSPSSRRRRSFSISPSPVSLPRRRSFSPRRSRSRRRSRSYRRSPVRRRTRTPLRMRSPSPDRINSRRPQRYRRRSLSVSSRSRSRSRSRGFTPRKSRSRSRIKNKRKKSKDRRKKKSKKRTPSPSSSPPKRTPHRAERREGARKKKRRSRTKTPLIQTWSPTPPLPVIENDSWTPPLVPSNAGNLTVIVKNKENAAGTKKKKDKKKKGEKRRDQTNRREKRKQRSEIRESPVPPSKEVFASGDNILVSVSFNKDGNLSHTMPQQTTVVTLPPTREEIISKRRTPDKASRKQKKAKEKSQRRHRKVDAKPVAIIDLDRSPFQEIAQSPRDVIILTDSDHEGGDSSDFNNHNINMDIEPLEQANGDHLPRDNMEKCANAERVENSQEEQFEPSLQQVGPKTPPEPPVVKFSLASKAKQIKTRNPLHDEQDESHNEEAEEESQEMEQPPNKIGPNTPPESGPCSPDAYDPFDPTKSPSASPSPAPQPEISTPVESESRPPEESRESRPLINQEKNINPVELVMALMNPKVNKPHDICNINSDPQYTMPNSEVAELHEKSDENNLPKGITVLSNVLITPGKVQQRSTGNLTTIASPVSKNSQGISMSGQNMASKLPLPKTSSNNRQNGGTAPDDSFNEIESPYSPGSDDYDDLFEPPPENALTLQQISQRPRIPGKQNKPSKAELFDNLFGNTSPIKVHNYTSNVPKKRGVKPYKKTSVKVAKLPGGKDEDQIKILDELPSSAVELQVKDKFLRKLNRQERVVEEVKLVLKPHYNKKHVTKEDYKEILRRAVPKICHSRSGEINPKKIQNLIEAYVRKFRQRNKLNLLNTGQMSSAVKCAAYLKKL